MPASTPELTSTKQQPLKQRQRQHSQQLQPKLTRQKQVYPAPKSIPSIEQVTLAAISVITGEAPAPAAAIAPRQELAANRTSRQLSQQAGKASVPVVAAEAKAVDAGSNKMGKQQPSPHQQQPNNKQKPQQQQPQPHLQRGAFFQLTGHKECFKPGTRPDTLLKRITGNEEQCLSQLKSSDDPIRPFVPRVLATSVCHPADGHQYLEMQNLLANYCGQVCVMDIKMGCRTYLEEELDSALREAKLRRDMYDKMIEVDPNEPTDEEKEAKAITKPRYMIWRETVSSTASLAFRIEAMRLRDGSVDKNFKTIRDVEQIAKALMRYATSNKIRLNYLNRLYNLKNALLQSEFFKTHELIGSSLLFVHDDHEASIWLIDFAKTHQLPANAQVTHKRKWELGNHEDGYLIGIDNLISIFERLIALATTNNSSDIVTTTTTSNNNNNIIDSTTEQMTSATNAKQQQPKLSEVNYFAKCNFAHSSPIFKVEPKNNRNLWENVKNF